MGCGSIIQRTIWFRCATVVNMIMVLLDWIRRLLLNTIFINNRYKSREKLLDDLPENCIYNILGLLPLESLCTSRLVCKSWYSIVDSTDFKNGHLHRSDTRGIIFTTPVQNYSPQPKKVFSAESNSTVTDPFSSFHIKFMEFNKDGKSRIKEYNNTAFRGRITAACDGIIVLEKGIRTRKLMLLNPVTREVEDIPTGTISSVRDGDLYGLAFSHKSRRYKLLRLFMKDEIRNLGCEIMDIGSGSGSWRAVDVPPTESYHLLHSPVFAMGALHWIQHVDDGHDGEECMVSMSLDDDDDDEKFKTTLIPSTAKKGHMLPFNTVLAMGEFLGFSSRDDDNQIKVWILRDNEWEKQYDIDASEFGYMTPLLYIDGDDEKLVFKCGDKCFYAYDRHSGDLTKIETINGWAAANNEYWTILPHVNSLVSWKRAGR